MNKKLNVGILGFGRIGSSVVKIIDEGKNKNFKITKIFDLPSKKSLIGPRYEENAVSIITDSNIDIIIDTLGGYDFPYQLIKSALRFRKHVITANKEIVAKNIEELTTLADENEVAFLYEATVCGGLPVVYPLSVNARCNEISQIYGIMSGSANYILTRMQQDGIDYKKSVELAQENKFMEKNPKEDLNGLDVARKLAIMTDISYQTKVNPADVYCRPISSITEDVIEFATNNKQVIKYLGIMQKKGRTLSLSVEPYVFGKDHYFASINEEENVLVINSKYNGKLTFSGLGVGGDPTATAIVSDVLRVLNGIISYGYENQYTFNINTKHEYKGDYIVKMKGEEPTYMDGKNLQKVLEDKKLQFYAKVWQELE